MSPSIQINAPRFLQQVTNVNKSLRVHTHIHTNKYIEHLNNNNKHEIQTCMTTRIYKLSQKTSLEADNANLPFRQCSLDYKRAEQSDHMKKSN